MGWLGLSRRKGERVYIGDEIVIAIRAAEAGKCSLAIYAPDDLKILREEVLTEEEQAEKLLRFPRK